MERHEARALAGAATRVLAWWRTPATWRVLQRNGMTTDFSWDAAAPKYVEQYERARSMS
jgi:starch synthase